MEDGGENAEYGSNQLRTNKALPKSQKSHHSCASPLIAVIRSEDAVKLTMNDNAKEIWKPPSNRIRQFALDSHQRLCIDGRYA